MSVERKTFTTKKEKPKSNAPKPKKLKKSMNLDVLQDAVVEGKLTVGVGANLIVERFRDGKTVLSSCKIMKIFDDGSVDTWDETIGQFFSFKTTEKLPKIKVSTEQ